MDLIFSADIRNPPLSVSISGKKYYLNANIFYSGVKPWVRSTIVDQCKKFLEPYFKACPLLDDGPYCSQIVYCSDKDIDLDNKCYFWRKIIHDLLCEKRAKDNSPSIKLGKIKDDSTRFFMSNEDVFYSTSDTRMIFSIFYHE